MSIINQLWQYSVAERGAYMLHGTQRNSAPCGAVCLYV